MYYGKNTRRKRVFLFQNKMFKSSLYRSLCLYILAALVVILPSGLSAFDTYWHSQISTQVGRQYGFSADAVKTMQFASFAVDYFWVFLADVESTIEKGLSYLEFKNTPLTIAERNAAKYLHFDNLKLQIDQNWKFDYLWLHLL